MLYIGLPVFYKRIFISTTCRIHSAKSFFLLNQEQKNLLFQTTTIPETPLFTIPSVFKVQQQHKHPVNSHALPFLDPSSQPEVLWKFCSTVKYSAKVVRKFHSKYSTRIALCLLFSYRLYTNVYNTTELKQRIYNSI